MKGILKGTLFRIFVPLLFYAGLGQTFAFQAQASQENQTYYVAKNGNDHWSGKLPKPNSDDTDGPFLTLQKASKVLNAGDVCAIRQGVYRETLASGRSGNPSKKIHFTKYKDEKVVISGCDTLEREWIKVSENIHKTKLKRQADDPFLFHRGKLATEARWPNSSGDLLRPSFGKVDNGAFNAMTATDLPDDIDLKGAVLYGFFGKEWALRTFDVSAYDSSAKTMSFPEAEQRKSYYGEQSGWDKNYAPREGNRFYVVGHYDLLDADGEWFYDDEKEELFVYLENGKHPKDQNIESKAREYAIDLSGRSHIAISGIEIFGAGIRTDDTTEHCLIEKVKGNYVEPGINIGGSHNEINSCEFAYNSKGIVMLSGQNNRAINNYIHDGNYLGGWDQILNTRGSGHLVSHNTISSAGGGCIGPGGTHMRFQYNEVCDAGLIRHDVGGFYVANNDGAGTVIHHNRVHEVYGIGIYLDNSTSNYTIHHNVIYNCGWEFVLSEPPPSFLSIGSYDAVRLNTPGNYNLVYNNTCHNEWGMGYWGRNFEEDMYGDHSINNIFTGSYNVSDNLRSANNLYKEEKPRFKNSGTYDFQLTAESPAIDKGMPLLAVTDGFSGKAPDLGAYEFGTKPWAAGHDFDASPRPEFGQFKTDFMNLVMNGTFEKGIMGWRTDGAALQLVNENSWGIETAKTRMQSHALELPQNSNVEQTITELKSNTTYTASCWVKTSGTAKTTLTVEIGGKTFSTATVSTDQWEFVKVDFKTDGPSQAAMLKITNDSQVGKPSYVDDVGLIRHLAN